MNDLFVHIFKGAKLQKMQYFGAFLTKGKVLNTVFNKVLKTQKTPKSAVNKGFHNFFTTFAQNGG